MIAAAQEACVSQHNGASICAVLLPSPVCEMDRTADFTDVVRKFRKVYGVSKPSSELMKPIKTTSQFTTAATTIVRAATVGSPACAQTVTTVRCVAVLCSWAVFGECMAT